MTIGTIGLDELDELASLQTRRDRKYLVSSRVVDEVLARLGGARRLIIDGRDSFGYESVYFDTPDLRFHQQAARKRPGRVKVRVRTYVDSGSSFLEVKTRDGRRRTVKHRVAHDGRRHLDVTDLLFVDAVTDLGATVGDLVPVLTTRFERSTFLVEGGRATVDRAIEFEDADGGHRGLGDLVIVETKSALRPTQLDLLLWQTGTRPVKVSKYGAGLAALRPGLPANKWSQALRRIEAAAAHQ